jgi:predicted flap endonuclease-1-like 5' DNA nuclease
VETTTATVEAATVSATAVETTAATVEATAYEATTATPATTVAATVSAPAASSPTVTVPRPSAEEDAAVEPLRTIVAVGRAGIGRVSVVAILTIGQNVSVTAADVDSKRNLRVGGGRRRQDESKDCKQCEVLKTTHGGSPYCPCSSATWSFDAGGQDLDAYVASVPYNLEHQSIGKVSQQSTPSLSTMLEPDYGYQRPPTCGLYDQELIMRRELQ